MGYFDVANCDIKSRKIDELAENVDMHDKAITIIFHDLERLISGESEPTPEPAQEEPKEQIGFKTTATPLP